MLARNVAADVSVIGLVGERGREVQEFIQDDLGPEGLARSPTPKDEATSIADGYRQLKEIMGMLETEN
jgi:flagellar biosynthesis/type III secretory pathway ATPase